MGAILKHSATRYVVAAGLFALTGCIQPNWEYELRDEGLFVVDGQSYFAAKRYARVANGTDPNWDFDSWIVIVDGREIDCGTEIESCTRAVRRALRSDAFEGGGDDGGSSGGGSGGGGAEGTL